MSEPFDAPYPDRPPPESPYADHLLSQMAHQDLRPEQRERVLTIVAHLTGLQRAVTTLERRVEHLQTALYGRENQMGSAELLRRHTDQLRSLETAFGEAQQQRTALRRMIITAVFTMLGGLIVAFVSTTVLQRPSLRSYEVHELRQLYDKLQQSRNHPTPEPP